MENIEENNKINKEINIFFDDTGEDLQKIVDNLLLEIYTKKISKVCNTQIFGV